MLNSYQQASRQTAVYPEAGANWLYPALGLAGEVGEICNKLKKVLRDDGGRLSPAVREAVGDELGDVLWYIAQLATELGLDLNDLAQANLVKLASRQARGTLCGSGDKR